MEFVTVSDYISFFFKLFLVSLLPLKSSECMVSLSQYVLSVFTCPLFSVIKKFVVRAIKTQVFLALESIIKSSCKSKARDLIKKK